MSIRAPSGRPIGCLRHPILLNIRQPFSFFSEEVRKWREIKWKRGEKVGWGGEIGWGMGENINVTKCHKRERPTPSRPIPSFISKMRGRADPRGSALPLTFKWGNRSLSKSERRDLSSGTSLASHFLKVVYSRSTNRMFSLQLINRYSVYL